MTIICGACGEEMELPTGGLIAGQHVICPHCGEKTVYKAPTRIEIPIGAIPKQKLGVRRSAEATAASQVDLNAQAIIRKMYGSKCITITAAKSLLPARPFTLGLVQRLVLLRLAVRLLLLTSRA